MATNQTKSAIPLVLPNSCIWDAQTGTYDKKKGVAREALHVIPNALDQLSEIKGPVCVVSIAGPQRKGKSFIIGEAFDQGEVFPLGHLLDPETMGIWLWVVPQKFKDDKGQEFTVVLLDSEGVDSVYAQKTDDHRIFTLSVLLSSILIYNSAGVPNRSDLEGLDFIVKLSQRIQLHAKHKDSTDKDESHFYKTFPNFIWLLRDVVLNIPPGYTNLKDYLLNKVLNSKSGSQKAESTGQCTKVADSILSFFSGFDAFSLPSPSVHPKVVQNLNDKSLKSQVNPKFPEGLEGFKIMLKAKLAPNKSINDGEFITGEALSAMVQLFVDALNTPGTVPNVQNAWDTFVQNKCTDVLAAAVTTYKTKMTSQIQDEIPCKADVIRAAHEKTLDACLVEFHRETFSLSSKSVDTYVTKFMEKGNSVLEDWIQENRSRTEVNCKDILKKLKAKHLSPVLTRLRGPGAAKMEFKDVVECYNKIEERYKIDARGAKDVQATVLMNFIPELRDDMQQNVDVLKRMKDYDEKVERVKAENIVAEEQQRRFEELRASWEEEKRNMEKQMEILIEKQEEDTKRIQQISELKIIEEQEQMKNMMKANFEERRKERQEAIQRQEKKQKSLQKLRKMYAEKREEKEEIENKIQESYNPGFMDVFVPIAPLGLGIIKAVADNCSIM